MSLPPSPIGFDASVLINFWKVERLDLLVVACPPPRFVLQDVFAELEEEGCARLVQSMIDAGEVSIAGLTTDEELERWAEYSRRLDAGESATLAAAVLHGWSIVLDDKAARRLAIRDLGKGRVTGTIGILRQLAETRSLSHREGNELLSRMIAAGFRSPVRRLEDRA